MNKQEKELFIKLTSELEKERQCCDLLADALIQGGMDRTFEALTYHELLRNGIKYPRIRLSRPRRSPNHPTIGYSHDTPFDQDEEE